MLLLYFRDNYSNDPVELLLLAVKSRIPVELLLLAAKSRIGPLKCATLTRMKLLAGLIGAIMAK